MDKNESNIETVAPCLEIEENIQLQKKGWALQIFGWLFIMGMMLAGALGVFGEGVLSKRTLTEGNSRIEYEGLFRYETEMKILIESKDHIASLSFPDGYLKHFRIVRIVPEPVNNNTIHKTVRYNFLPSENNVLSVYLVAKDYGNITGVLKINEKQHFTLNHFIFP